VVYPFWVTLDRLTACFNLLCNYDTRTMPIPGAPSYPLITFNSLSLKAIIVGSFLFTHLKVTESRACAAMCEEVGNHVALLKLTLRSSMDTNNCCTEVSPLTSLIHVSGLDDIWHMSLRLNTGNVINTDTTDLSLPTDLVV
jgi:hypothetical protein